jgi:hypothetical protein
MKSKTWIMATAGPLVLGIISTAAQAVPITNSAADLRTAVANSSSVDDAAFRRCWRHNGRRHCAWYGRPGGHGYRGGGDYYEHDPDKLPYGSQRWWDEMLRENRAGNPGGGGKR